MTNMGSGFSKMKKQAKQFQEKLAKMQEEMEGLEVTGRAGNNLVKMTLSGEKVIKSISINPECVDSEDVEGLEDLIMAAHKDALSKLEETHPSSMLGSVPQGLPFS